MAPSPNEQLREDMHRVEDAVGDLRERIAKHEGQDEARHEAQMAAIASVQAEQARTGDALRDLAGRLPAAGLTEDKSKDTPTVTVKARGFALPPIGTSLRAGALVLFVGGPIVGLLGALLGWDAGHVDAVVKAAERAGTALQSPAVLRVDASLPAPEPVAPAGPSVQPVEPQE